MTLPYPPAAKVLDQLLEDEVVSRVWNRDISVWHATPGSADARSIQTRLGWLEVGATMEPALPQVAKFSERLGAQGIEAVFLLGMGGSSLCAEVLSSVAGVAQSRPNLFVLDTTDEATISAAAARLDPAKTAFLVSSKSGGTVEVASLEKFFWALMQKSRGSQTGRHFAAITDPGTGLQQLAQSRGYGEIFVNPADIGGRFSALSLFGLVPSGVIGNDPVALLHAGATMAEGCRQEHQANPGLQLGAFIGAAALEGRNKLTLLLPRSLASLGLWVEQLVAESTGKHGKGALPVVDEPLGRPDEYGTDRAFVAIATDRDEPDADEVKAIEEAGHPVLRLSTRIDGLGAEFFRWEFATAIAGAVLGINPFDEPNVAEAKEKTRSLLAGFASAGTLAEPQVLAADEGIEVFSPTFVEDSPVSVIKAALRSLAPGDYVAMLSYLPASHEVETRVAEIRQALRRRFRVATTFGVGPRYLHSTGQYHKGGPNNVLAFVITGEDDTQTPIPDAGYSFSILKRAQALGDVETLAAHGRRVVRLHLRDASVASLENLFARALG